MLRILEMVLVKPAHALRNIFSRQIHLWNLIWKRGFLYCITSINFD